MFAAYACARVKVTVPARLIVPLLKRFIATDRGFAKALRQINQSDSAT
nr:DUF2274 domain-containing protein [Brucella gallinifaecis]